MKIPIEFRIDWPHGSLGFIPWTHRDRECGVTYYWGWRREIRVDLERTYKRSVQKARRAHAAKFETFVAELVDTVVHEVHHAFEPRFTRKFKSERGAERFGACAQWVQR